MNKKEALKKLKKFWEEHSQDYLNSLIQLKKEIPSDHESYVPLEKEIDKIKSVHGEFIIWKNKKEKKAKK